MRIEIRDATGYQHSIESGNPATIGLWLAEMSWNLMSVNASTAYQCVIQVWPSSDKERASIGHPAQIGLTDRLLEDLAFVLNSHA